MTARTANVSNRRIHPRRHARVAAMQVLFALDMSDESPDVVQSKVEYMAKTKAEARELLEGLVSGVRAHLAQIDEKIQHAASMWPMGQMALVDKAIMRLAVYELLYVPETPPKVVINEAVELAKIYASDNSPRFINGVLATIYERDVVNCPDNSTSA
ncbi:MAG: transcription antitermination factor NusB [Chloroflexi bacterium]|nr:transcription antitermination factor NusB [Chloroflexota bacterium]